MRHLLLNLFSMSFFQDNNEAVPEEEEPKEVSSNHNLGIAHPMFSQIPNFQFLIVFLSLRNCLFDEITVIGILYYILILSTVYMTNLTLVCMVIMEYG